MNPRVAYAGPSAKTLTETSPAMQFSIRGLFIVTTVAAISASSLPGRLARLVWVIGCSAAAYGCAAAHRTLQLRLKSWSLPWRVACALAMVGLLIVGAFNVLLCLVLLS